MKNYARKKSTPNKTAFNIPSAIRNRRLSEDSAIKASYRRQAVKGKIKIR